MRAISQGGKKALPFACGTFCSGRAEGSGLSSERTRSQEAAGADGCRGGWVVVAETGKGLEGWIAPDVRHVVERLPAGAVLAIDVPIGLPTRGDRLCCKEARRLLGRPRSSSVFPVPVRGCIGASSYEDASSLHREIDGRGLSSQTWSILPKIREVDLYLRSTREPRIQIAEIHPEVSFARWSGIPMTFRKVTRRGRAEREVLIDLMWPGWREAILDAIDGDFARDDLNDAFAALWTACRIATHRAVEMPAMPEFDDTGLPMRIVG